MKTLKFISKTLPFIAGITLNILFVINEYRLENLTMVIVIIGIILLANLFAIFLFKSGDHFSIAVSATALLGITAIFLSDTIGLFYIKNVIAALYLGLFFAALLPPLFKKEPFTVSFSKGSFPPVIVKSDLFKKVNNIISYVWAGLFLMATVLSIIHYSDSFLTQIILSSVIPAIPLVIIGIPATKLLPDRLNNHLTAKPIVFNSITEAFEAMPFGLNKKLAKGINTVVQFEFTGKEAGTRYLIIKNQKCIAVEGAHPSPDTVIHSDSDLWLQITNKTVSGTEAFINEDFTIDGDASIMLIFEDMFASPREADVAEYIPKEINYQYKIFKPGKINNIVVFDGGARNSNYSKTSFMVHYFIEGVKEAGARVEYFKLKHYNIHDCTGCYTCWTKTPGACIFKDDMTMLREKFRSADLVVFASPLYFFNVTGIMKTFLDRLLPLMKPYMLVDETGMVKHPDRYPEKGEQGFVVFSAGGFPEVDQNFDGLRAMFRMMDKHSENIHLMGEFFLTAAEVIVQPIYSGRTEEVKKICRDAGKQVVTEGKIDKALMQRLTFPWASTRKFQQQADAFWRSLEGKERYLTKIHRIEFNQ